MSGEGELESDVGAVAVLDQADVLHHAGFESEVPAEKKAAGHGLVVGGFVERMVGAGER